MAKCGYLLFCYISSIFILAISSWCSAADEERQVYIVYMGSLPEGEYSPSVHHLSILQEVVDGRSVMDTLIRSYKKSFNGFAAKLTDKEKQRLASMKGVVSVFPSRTYQLHTTRSWDFMGLPESINPQPTVESDVIVGVIDTGLWPESESFNDEGFGPAPKKWKGACKGGQNFTCNNKLIGARYYTSDNSTRDIDGHGSHTASTAAGNKVKDASFFGVAKGTARGGVPSARIAAYKVCSPEGCEDTDILAAFDDAIADGVDIITISLGASNAVGFDEDSIAIGAFHAMEKGIVTSQSAGNKGPESGTAVSVAPWVLSVAASSTDRRIIDKVVLGNGRTLSGNVVNSFTLNGTNFPLVYGKNNPIICDEDSARGCVGGCLDISLVEGKIVLCDHVSGISEARRVGALGSITPNYRFEDYSVVFAFPEVGLSVQDYDVVKSYMNSTNPRGTILKSESKKDLAAPVVVSFSSLGPNTIVPDILKPDVTAPGVDILAAYSPVALLTDSSDKRSTKYSILSGTSMACPHAAGVAAYVKTLHPDWSPSAIKSAIMTTAWTMNASKDVYAELAYGSGHINPVKAVDPGLVYELEKKDYINFLCSIGLDVKAVRLISGDNSTCPKEKASPRNLNYPSMAAQIPPNQPFNISFHRTVTNVGRPNSTYKAKIVANSQITVKVVPNILTFKSLNEKKTFIVTAVGGALPVDRIVSSALVWSAGNHTVRSPVIAFTVLYHPKTIVID